MTFSVQAQKKKKQEEAPATPVAATKPATPPAKKPETKKGPKAFKEVIDSTAVSSVGLMTVHKVADKWYFEIPDSLFGRDIMTVTRYAQTAAGAGAFGGEEINRQVIRWEMGPNENIFMRSITFVVISPDVFIIFAVIVPSLINDCPAPDIVNPAFAVINPEDVIVLVVIEVSLVNAFAVSANTAVGIL
jgi:hypothetical protein